MLCTEVTCPAAARQLFHSSTVERANQGCLLEQVLHPVRFSVGADVNHCHTDTLRTESIRLH